nr:MAG TPA: hypothetical protein [Caudoviricetes sp.]
MRRRRAVLAKEALSSLDSRSYTTESLYSVMYDSLDFDHVEILR